MNRQELGAVLNKHRHDSFSQDSGNHCVCGSDSRFEQRDGDHPWTTFGEHLYDVFISNASL